MNEMVAAGSLVLLHGVDLLGIFRADSSPALSSGDSFSELGIGLWRTGHGCPRRQTRPAVEEEFPPGFDRAPVGFLPGSRAGPSEGL
jgi:hypothetical protein